jgi:tetratricopeptide (TPR) repeat protein
MHKDKKPMATIANKLGPDSTPVRVLGSCLFFCSLCLATGASAGQSSPAVVRPARQASSHAKTPDGNARQEPPLVAELWSGRISAPDPNEDAQTRLALKRLIRQVRSVKFDSKSTAPAPALPAEPPAATESAKAEPATRSPEMLADPKSQTPNPASVKAQRTLQALLQDPNRVDDPLEMAELLYLSGRPTDAAPFYQKALDRMSPDDPTTDADRAWVLFQLGNCLRESDMTKAQEAYAKLIAKYPSSPWTEMAKAHGRIITWYQKTQPQQLIASEKP